MRSRLLELVKRLRSTGLGNTLSWALVSALTLQFLNVVNSVLLGRILKAENFGQYNLILMTVAIASSLGAFGMGVTATRFIANERGRGGTRLIALAKFMVFSCLTVSIVVSMIFLALAGIITHDLIHNPSLRPAYQVASLYIIGVSVDLVLVGILMGLEQFRLLAVTGFWKGLFTVLACSLLASSSGLMGAVMGISLGSLLGMILDGWFVWKYTATLTDQLEELDHLERQRILKFSLPIMVASLIFNPSVWLSSLLVSQLPAGSRLMAEFAVVRNWMIILQFFPLQISQALLPFLSRRAARPSSPASGLPLIVVSAIAIIIAIVSYPVGLWFVQLYGFHSTSITNGLMLIVLASVFSAINTMGGQMLLSEGHSWPRLAVDVLSALTLVVSVYVYIHLLGRADIALAAATTISLAIGAVGITLTQVLLRPRSLH